MEGFESLESAERYVCFSWAAIVSNASPTRVERPNEMSPLALEGVDLVGRDWLSFLLDR